jgi:hypothetical protein
VIPSPITPANVTLVAKSSAPKITWFETQVVMGTLVALVELVLLLVELDAGADDDDPFATDEVEALELDEAVVALRVTPA